MLEGYIKSIRSPKPLIIPTHVLRAFEESETRKINEKPIIKVLESFNANFAIYLVHITFKISGEIINSVVLH